MDTSEHDHSDVDVFDPDVADKLMGSFAETVRASDTEMPGDVAMAIMGVLGCVLISIRCPGCREAMRESIEQALPPLFDEAMKQAARRPQGSSRHAH